MQERLYKTASTNNDYVVRRKWGMSRSTLNVVAAHRQESIIPSNTLPQSQGVSLIRIDAVSCSPDPRSKDSQSRFIWWEVRHLLVAVPYPTRLALIVAGALSTSASIWYRHLRYREVPNSHCWQCSLLCSLSVAGQVIFQDLQ
jgi:hypothetical protein